MTVFTCGVCTQRKGHVITPKGEANVDWLGWFAPDGAGRPPAYIIHVQEKEKKGVKELVSHSLGKGTLCLWGPTLTDRLDG